MSSARDHDAQQFDAHEDLNKKIERLTANLKQADAHRKLLEASLAELKTKAQPQQSPQQDSGNNQPPAPEVCDL